MYTATMNYYFKPEMVQDACDYWINNVLESAQQFSGFIRMQLYSREDGQVLAIGTWTEKEHAQEFMQTGIFRRLMEDLEEMIEKDPVPLIWDTQVFAQQEDPFSR